MKPRACIVTPYHYSKYKGGNEQLAEKIAQSVYKTYSLRYITSLANKNNNNYQIISSAKITSSYIPSIPLIKDTFSQKPSIIHTLGSQSSLYIILAIAKIIKIKTIHSYHAPLSNSLVGSLISYLERLCIILCATSVTTLNEGSYQKIRRFKKKTYLLPPCIESFEDKEDNIKKNNFTAIFIGKLDRHHYYKGLEVLIRAMKNIDIKWHLHVVGDGPLKKNFEKQVDQSSLTSNITFHGEVSETRKRALLKKATLCIIPSTTSSEGFGIVALEAISQNTPVIITNVAGVANKISSHKLGVVITPNNPNEIAKAVNSYSYDQYQHALKNKAGFLEKYSVERFQLQVKRIYNDSNQ